ncbi:hypothetical protein QTP88_022340 [Uroleucon formosanum]
MKRACESSEDHTLDNRSPDHRKNPCEIKPAANISLLQRSLSQLELIKYTLVLTFLPITYVLKVVQKYSGTAMF